MDDNSKFPKGEMSKGEFPQKKEVTCDSCGVKTGLWKAFDIEGKFYYHCYHCGHNSPLQDYHADIPKLNDLENEQR